MRICPSCGEENADRARFCQACGTPLAPPAGSTEERKIVSVLFVDLVDFTARAETLDPEDVRSILAPYHDRVRSVIEPFGGSVEKFIGDAVVGVFGAPVAHGDDPERAVRAAIAVRDALQAMNEEDPDLQIRVRLAVNSGEAIVTLGARPERGEAMVAGDVVNTAARLQSAAPPNGILVGEVTYAGTRGAIEYSPVEPVQAKGKAKPVPAWLVVGPLAPVGERSFSDVPMVGRGAELALLRGIWERVEEERRPHLVTVFGPTGIGKSRLSHELAHRVMATGGHTLRARSIPYGESGPYEAFGQVVKQVAEIFDNDPLPDALEKVHTAVADLAPGQEADETTAHLAMLIGLRTDEDSVPDRETLFFSARVLVEGLAARRPMLLFFEDIHWADASLLDLIESLAARMGDVPVLILTTARPELLARRPSWAGGMRAYTSVGLEPLSSEEAADLTRRLLSLHEVEGPPDRVEELATTAEGNPLFIEELATSMAEGATPVAGALPTNVLSIVGARLDALPAAERSALLDAAVVGKVFWRGTLTDIQPDREDLSAVLGSLEQRGMIRRETVSRIRGEHQYSFKHALIRDVAYNTLPRAERRKRHAVAARFLEKATPDLGDTAAALAYHWREAGEDRVALGYVMAAADQAGRGWAKERAIELYREALGLLRDEDQDLRREIVRKQAVAEMALFHVIDAMRLRSRAEERP
jgi:class 3 adenylate cyclase